MKTLIRWLRLRQCMICGRRAGVSLRHLGEPLDPATSPAGAAAVPATWLLCEECHLAVGRELARAGLHSAARVQVALGVVAAERRQTLPRYPIWDERHWEHLSDRDQDRALIWLFGIAFVVHALAFIVVAAYVTVAH